MRTSSSAIVLGLFFVAACGGDPPPAAEAPPAPTVAEAPAPPPAPEPAPVVAPKPTMAELQAKTMKNLVDNFGDAKAHAASFAEDGLVTMAGMPDMKGRDGIQKGHQGFVDGFPDIKMGITRTFQKGNVLVSEFVVTGTNSKDWMGSKATNKTVGLNGASVFWFNDDGLVKEEHVYFDGGTMMGQLGLSKQKVRPVAVLPTTTEAKVAKSGGDEDKNLDTVKAMYASFDSKKEADFLGSIDDAIEFDDMAQPATSKGKADAKKFFQMWTKAIPDQKNTLTNAWAFDDYVVAEYNLTGTHKGPIGPLKATGKPLNLHGVDIFRYTGGKVVKGASYSNGGEMMAELGLMPKPGAAPAAKPAAAPAKPAATPAAKPAAAPAAAKPAAKK